MSIKHKCKETDDPFVIKEKDAYTSEILDTLKTQNCWGGGGNHLSAAYQTKE
jgi:hypothetical protein